MSNSTPQPDEQAPTARPSHSSRPPRAIRIRTLLILLAVIVTVALGTQVTTTAVRLLDQADSIRDDSVTGNKAGLPSYMLLEQMQAERRLTAARIGGGPVSQQDLEAQRAATDQAEAAFQRLSGPELPKSDRFVYDYVVMVKDKMIGLQEQRRLADTRAGDPQKVLDFYSTAIDQMIRLYQEMSNMDDGPLTYETRALVGLMHAFEALSREDALLALAGPSRKLTDEQYAEFARNVGVQRFIYGTWVAPYLPGKDKAIYDGIVATPAWATQTRVEDAVIADHTRPAAGGVVLPAESQEWQAARDQLRGRLTGLNVSRVTGLLDNTFAKAKDLRRDAWWLAGGSAAAVLVIVIVVLLTIRTVLRRTNKLRRHALDLAEDRLPDIIASLQRGDAVNTGDLPDPTGAKDEIGQIGDAVATLARQASDGAELVYRERQGFERFAEGVTGRSVVLVGVQLRLLDDLMRLYDQDPELITRLYGLDHQTVRLRRQIENLQVLSGGVISNPHEAPAHIANLLMDAAGEAAGHERVEKHFLADARVVPSAASELTHVLAELIENAARYSPPDFKVVVRAQAAVHGVTVEVEDRGMGLSPEQYQTLNERLGQVPLYAEMAENASQLGLFVVGRLAARLGLDVTLRRSVYGGTAAVVLIPRALLANQDDRPPHGESGPAETGEVAEVRPMARAAVDGATGPEAGAGERRESGRHARPSTQEVFASSAVRPTPAHTSAHTSAPVAAHTPAPEPDPDPAPEPAVASAPARGALPAAPGGHLPVRQPVGTSADPDPTPAATPFGVREPRPEPVRPEPRGLEPRGPVARSPEPVGPGLPGPLPGQRLAAPVDHGTYHPAADTDESPLPRRARGTHLAAQLREDTGAVPQIGYEPDSPEAARDMYRGLQAAFDQAEQPGRFNHAGRAEDDPASR